VTEVEGLVVPSMTKKSYIGLGSVTWNQLCLNLLQN